MGPAFKDEADQDFRIGAVFGGPFDDPGGCPFQVFLMTFRPVFRQGCMPAGKEAANMGGNPVIFIHKLYD